MTREEKQHLRSEIGTVFQGSALFDSLTVEENIMFPLDMFTNLTFREKKKRVFEVIGRVHLDKKNFHLKFPEECRKGLPLQELLSTIRNIFSVMSPTQGLILIHLM
jgi:phospholipid/cholesterol/gamma-HCH transport system ATP-binding protein